MMTEKAKQWLQLFRAQTFAATLLLLMTGYLVGGGKLFTIEGLLVGIFALLAHFMSFGENSLLDFTQGFDTNDPSKAHHPLIKGDISKESAMKVIHTGILLTAFFGIWLAWHCGGNFTFAILALLLFSYFGEAYNKGLDKVSYFSFVPISLCFTALVFYGYFLSAERINMLIILVVLYVYFRIHAQIDISGNIKDIETPERNMLEKMGTRVENNYFYPGRANIYGGALTFAEVAIGVWIFIEYAFTIWVLPFVAFFMGTGTYFMWQLLRKREWNRSKSLVDMSIAEIGFIYALPIILAPLIGYLEVIVLLVFGIIYWIIINSVLWGRRMSPAV